MDRGEVGIGNSHAQLSLPWDLYKWNKVGMGVTHLESTLSSSLIFLIWYFKRYYEFFDMDCLDLFLKLKAL